MRLTTAIQIIRYFNTIFLLGLIICVMGIVFNADEGRMIIFEVLIALPFFMALFFRVALINLYLKKCKYPVIFLSVLSKLGLTRDLDINWSEDAEKDIEQPTYSTEQFLYDNRLTTDIGVKNTHFTAVILFFFIVVQSVIAVYLYRIKTSPKQMNILYGCLLIFVIMTIRLWVNKRKPKDDINPQIRFTSLGLITNNGQCKWNDIFDWNYKNGGEYDPDKVIIFYYDMDKNVREEQIKINELNTNEIDVMLLLTHFKSKYG